MAGTLCRSAAIESRKLHDEQSIADTGEDGGHFVISSVMYADADCGYNRDNVREGDRRNGGAKA